MQERTSKGKTLYYLGGIGVILFILGTLIFVGILWYSPSGSQHEESIFVENTVEFNIKIESISSWTDRMANMTTWMEFFDSKSEFFTLSESETSFTSHTEYTLNITGVDRCNTEYSAHINQYLDGEKDGLFSINLKGTNEERDNAFYMPLWPASKYQAKSTQRCERDEYQCSNEFTRSSKVSFSQPKELVTCRDLAVIYPRAFNLSTTQYENTVALTSHEIWYTYEYNGNLNEDTKYKAKFEFRYSSVNDALHGADIPTKGKWSIRLYSLEEGRLTLWDNEVVKDITAAWLKLANHFGDGYCTVVY